MEQLFWKKMWNVSSKKVIDRVWRKTSFDCKGFLKMRIWIHKTCEIISTQLPQSFGGCIISPKPTQKNSSDNNTKSLIVMIWRFIFNIPSVSGFLETKSRLLAANKFVKTSEVKGFSQISSDNTQGNKDKITNKLNIIARLVSFSICEFLKFVFQKKNGSSCLNSRTWSDGDKMS